MFCELNIINEFLKNVQFFLKKNDKIINYDKINTLCKIVVVNTIFNPMREFLFRLKKPV